MEQYEKEYKDCKPLNMTKFETIPEAANQILKYVPITKKKEDAKLYLSYLLHVTKRNFYDNGKLPESVLSILLPVVNWNEPWSLLKSFSLGLGLDVPMTEKQYSVLKKGIISNNIESLYLSDRYKTLIELLNSEQFWSSVPSTDQLFY